MTAPLYCCSPVVGAAVTVVLQWVNITCQCDIVFSFIRYYSNLPMRGDVHCGNEAAGFTSMVFPWCCRFCVSATCALGRA